jgi:hypothetical protein
MVIEAKIIIESGDGSGGTVGSSTSSSSDKAAKKKTEWYNKSIYKSVSEQTKVITSYVKPYYALKLVTPKTFGALTMAAAMALLAVWGKKIIDDYNKTEENKEPELSYGFNKDSPTLPQNPYGQNPKLQTTPVDLTGFNLGGSAEERKKEIDELLKKLDSEKGLTDETKKSVRKLIDEYKDEINELFDLKQIQDYSLNTILGTVAGYEKLDKILQSNTTTMERYATAVKTTAEYLFYLRGNVSTGNVGVKNFGIDTSSVASMNAKAGAWNVAFFQGPGYRVDPDQPNIVRNIRFDDTREKLDALYKNKETSKIDGGT